VLEKKLLEARQRDTRLQRLKIKISLETQRKSGDLLMNCANTSQTNPFGQAGKQMQTTLKERCLAMGTCLVMASTNG
jgi:hypothetical protein